MQLGLDPSDGSRTQGERARVAVKSCYRSLSLGAFRGSRSMTLGQVCKKFLSCYRKVFDGFLLLFHAGLWYDGLGESFGPIAEVAIGRYTQLQFS